MLSRTADHLYWMSRYTERAENLARMLDVNYQMSLLPQSAQTIERGWAAWLEISELTAAFSAQQPAITPEAVMRPARRARKCSRGERLNHHRVVGDYQHDVA